MERRAIIALVLSALLIMTYPLFMKKYYAGKKVQQPKEVVLSQTPENIVEEIENEQEIKIETNKYILLFSNLGGSIKGIWLKEYKTENQSPTKILMADSPAQACLGVSDIDPALKSQSQPYSHQKGDNYITFKLEQPGASSIEKKYTFSDDNYDIKMDLNITNLSGFPKEYKYKINVGTSMETKGGLEARYIQLDSLVNDKVVRKGSGSVKKSGLIEYGQIHWAALKSRYFSLVLKPQTPAEATISNILSTKNIYTQLEMPKVTIDPSKTATHKYFLYAGPNKVEYLKEYDLEKVVDFGMFDPISKFILSAMRLFTRVIPNWGVAIILMTIVISLTLYPLTFKSLKSMKQMQAIQPQVNEMRTLYKDNPQKLNKEIMELYKKNKVNPLGGCLPMIIQMPVFIALYQLLVKSIELKDSKFLWINDLSSPDRFMKINFTLPFVGNYINLLPIFTIGIMFLQQRMTQVKTGDQQQKMLAVMMPILFGALFYNFPSGFLLYFMTSTVLMIFYQSAMKVAKSE